MGSQFEKVMSVDLPEVFDFPSVDPMNWLALEI